MTWIYWVPFGTAVLHIVEEFVWPGGFLPWYRAYLPDLARSFTPRFIVLINGVLLAMGAAAALLCPTPNGVSIWLTVSAVELSNVGFHVLGTVRTRSYSPGLVTAVLLYVPAAVYGYWWFVATGLASIENAALALVLGASYPLWSTLNHRRRARRAG